MAIFFKIVSSSVGCELSRATAHFSVTIIFHIIQLEYADMPHVLTAGNLKVTPADRLVRLCADPEVELRVIVELLQNDQILADKVIEMANGSTFGTGFEINNLELAVSLLGKQALSGIGAS